MKARKFFAILIYLSSLFGCIRPTSNSATAGYLRADKTSWIETQSSGKEILTISSNVDWAVNVSALPSWITLLPAKGNAGDTKVEIAYASNTNLDSRTASFTFSPLDNSTVSPLNVQVIQSGITSSVSTDKTICHEDSAGQKDSLVITATGDWQMSGLPVWISTMDALTGKAGTTKIHFTISANTSPAERAADISISTSGTTAVVQKVHFEQNVYYQLQSFSPAVASTGDQITAQGIFGAGAVATINGVNATPVSEPDYNHILFTVPAGATTGKVMIRFGSTSLTSTTDLVISSSKLILLPTTGLPSGYMRKFGVSFVYNNKIYYGLGTDGTNTYFNDFKIFDPLTNAWSQGPVIPSGMGTRVYASCFTLNNRIYIGMGTHGNYSDWWRYDPSLTGNAAWQQVTSYSRHGFAGIAFVLNNTAYAGIPYFDNGSIDQFEPPSNGNAGSWIPVLNSMPKLIYSSFFTLNGNAFLVGGQSLQGDSVSSAYKIDPTNANPVQPVASFPVVYKDAPSFSLNGKGYVVANNTIYAYDPYLNTWSDTMVSIPEIDGVNNAVVINGVAYIFQNDGTVYLFRP